MVSHGRVLRVLHVFTAASLKVTVLGCCICSVIHPSPIGFLAVSLFPTGLAKVLPCLAGSYIKPIYHPAYSSPSETSVNLEQITRHSIAEVSRVLCLAFNFKVPSTKFCPLIGIRGYL